MTLLVGAPDEEGVVRTRHRVDGSTDARGRFRFERLVAGHYALELSVRCADRRVPVPVGGFRQLRPSGSLDGLALSVNTAPIDLFVDADQPWPPGSRIVLRGATGGVSLHAALDEGRVRLEQLPADRYRAELRLLGSRAAPARSSSARLRSWPAQAAEHRFAARL